MIDRKHAATLGQETIQILERGKYQTSTGIVIEIQHAIDAAMQHTLSYPPDQSIADIRRDIQQTQIEVENETTLSAARRLTEAGRRTVALNFASAMNPGGGFLSGARAQEESLARSSGLYACLNGQAMYEYHRKQPNPMYSDYVIYSPGVPVFRTDEGTLLEYPYLCAFITCAAVNAKVVLERDPSRGSEIRHAMERRIARVLSVAAIHNHDALVLGAWGCGVFGNDTGEIANLFKVALTSTFQGVFNRVIFAILDWSADRRFLGPFTRAFIENPRA